MFLGLHAVYIFIVLMQRRIVACARGAVHPADSRTAALPTGAISNERLLSPHPGMSLNPPHSGMSSVLPPLVVPGVINGRNGASIQAGSPRSAARGSEASGLEPLHLDPPAAAPVNGGGSRSRAESGGRSRNTSADAPLGALWLWGDGAGGGDATAGKSCGLWERLCGLKKVPMAGLDCPDEGSSVLGRAVWLLELPLSFVRWLTIPSSDGEWDGRRRRWTVLTPPLAALLFACEVYGDLPTTAAARVGESAVPMWLVLAGAGVAVSCALYALTSDGAPPRWQPVLVVCGFVMTIVWLDLLANEMIAVIETIGHIANISTSILGLTVVAIGNSIGDFVADTAAARGGSVGGTRMAIAACFGSPVIMNILSVGISFGLRLLLTGFRPIEYDHLSRVARLGYILFYITVLSHLLVFPMCGYRAPRVYALYLFAIYATLISASCLLETGMLTADWLCEGAFYHVFGACRAGCVS